MTWVKAVVLMNWGPFEGEHRIELEADTYAVVAHALDDARRSNWLGKSRLLAAVPYALYGVRPERTEDECITRGTPAMMVRLELSTGAVIERGRKRGKATKVVATWREGEGTKQAESDGASLAAESWVGLDRGDFFATSFLRQKQISRMMTMEPSERGPLFFGWIDLGRADSAIETAHRRTELASAQVDRLTNELARLDLAISDLTESAGYETYKTALETSIEENEAALVETEKTLANIGPTEAAIAFADVDAKGRAARAQLDALPTEAALLAKKQAAEESVAKFDRDIGAQESDRARACSVLTGEFEGECPITGNPCPVADDIRAAGLEAGARVQELDGTILDLQGHRSLEAKKVADVGVEIHNRKALDLTLGGLRQRARELKAQAGGAAVPEVPPDGDALRSKAKQTTEALVAARADLATLEKHQASKLKLQAQLDEAKHQEATAGASTLVFERARRNVASRSLGEIESGATELLADAGVPLSVAIRWELEGSGLASFCTSCGVGFSTSKKVKQCARCGAERGPKMMDRLDVVTSSASGAAEDLGGLAVQLSAAAWLRGRRSSPWTAGFIDEPFGALDEANRRAISSHLAAALRGRYGFEQALVVSHQRDSIAGLKRRIEVISDGQRARLEVA